MLESIQVRDLSKYINSNTKLIIDSDGLAYKPASVIDEAYIEVLHKPSQRVKEFKNITEFKGNVRGQGKIGAGSWLDSTNITRKAKGQSEFLLDDFEITQKTRQKLGLSVATKNIDGHIQAIKDATGIQDATMVLGSGECFRHELLLPERYKANRDGPRPSQLGNCRQHIIENHNSLVVKDGKHEADDIVNMYAYKGYLDYLKTGKFSYLVASNDKDSRGTPSLLFDWSKSGDTFDNCKTPFLIEGTQKGVGSIELIKGSIKAAGFFNVIYQMCLGDSSDNYDPRSVCGKKKADKFGASSFYTDVVNMKTPKELLEYTIDKYKGWYPSGVNFTAWNGTEVKEPVSWWLNQMFSAVYMLRSKNDKTTFNILCKNFGVNI